jgi:hypothetical protein
MTEPQFYKSAIDATGCISNAWELIKPNYWLFFGISLLAAVCVGCIPCLNIFITGPIMGGVYFVALRQMRGEPIEFAMMFKGFEKFVPLMVIGLIQSIPGIISQGLNYSLRISDAVIKGSQGSRGIDYYQSAADPEIFLAGGMLIIVIVVSIFFLLFSIAWAVTFAFAVPIAMEHDIGAIDAIKLSAKAGWSNVGGIIVLAILLGLMAFGGVLVLCLGILFVLPIIHVAWAFAYRQVFPDLLPSTFRNEPPPPDAYGNFGRGM